MTCFVSSAVALTLALAQDPSVAVLPVDAAEAALAPKDAEALRTVASEALARTDADVRTELPEDARFHGVHRADAAWLSRTFAPHGVSHWLVTRVRGEARTYEIDVELWAVGGGDDEPIASTTATCEICGQSELRDLVAARVDEVAAALAPAPNDESTPRSLAPRRSAHDGTSTPTDRRTSDPTFRIAGYASLSAGAVALVAGSTLIALDGREHTARCRSGDSTVIDQDGDCRYVHNTLAGGISLVLGGVVASAGGITLLALDSRRRRKAELSMRIGHRRIALVGRF